MSPLQPTTRAQVSGHRFLKRRVEHGLEFGDIRMIHDPLRTRQRAMIFGVVAVLLGLAGAGLFAWLSPQPDPGDAPILRSQSGALYVRIDDRLHPVANLASARLIAGSPAEPVTIGESFFAAADKGAPVGIDPAPGVFAVAATEEETLAGQWSTCTTASGVISVLAGDAADTPAPLGAQQAVLAQGPDSQWLLTDEGRRALPDADTAEGRVVRRALGVDPDGPRLDAPPEILTAITELPAWRAPSPVPEIWTVGEDSWAADSGGGVSRLTPTQEEALAGLGAPSQEVSAARLAGHADAAPPELPEAPVTVVDPVGRQVCAASSGEVRMLDGDEVRGSVDLAGDGPATRFAGLASGAVTVDSGAGLFVVDSTGLRHQVNATDSEALGSASQETVSWEIVRLLPEGPALTSEDARRSRY